MSINNIPAEDNEFKNNSVPAKAINLKNKPFLLGFCTFTVLAVLIGVLVYFRLHIKNETQLKEARAVLQATKEKLQTSFEQSVTATNTLAFFINADGSFKDIDSIAPKILAANPNVDILELVPGGVITYVYPLKGNEAVIGYDIMHDSTRNKDAFTAIKKNELYFAGPLALKQGGVAVVGRLPVFRANHFWGFSCVIIKISSLLKSAGIDSGNKSGYHFQLSNVNPNTNQEEFFIPGSRPSKNHQSFTSINLPNGEWKLSIASAKSSQNYADFYLFGLLGLLFSFIGGWFVFVVARRPEKLNHLVKIRTAELQESEANYRSLIEQASDGVILYSFDGTILQFNKAAYLETGYTSEEFSKLNLKDLLVEDKPIDGHLNINSHENVKKANFQRLLRKKDGDFIDIELNVSLLPDDKLLAFIRDITDRLKTEKALQASEEKFSKAFQSNMLAFAIYDEKGEVIDANESYAAMLEISKNDLIGKNTDDTKLVGKFTLENRASIRASINHQLEKEGQIKNFETEIRTIDGKTVYLLLSFEPLEILDKKHLFISAIDIGNKKHAELAMAESEMKYRSLIEQASDGIVISDTKGIILEVNKSVCSLSGYSKEDMLGKHIESFIPEEDIEKIPFRINELTQGRALLYERRLLKSDGSIIEIEVNAKMASENTLIGFIRDISKRRKEAEELRNSNERFELLALASNDAIWDHDFNTDETIGNDNLYNLYGYTKGIDKITLDIFLNNIHPDERDGILKRMEEALDKKVNFISEEFRFMSVDGTYKNMYDRAYIKYDENGNALRILGVMHDITQREKGKALILKEKELSDLIINNLPAIFYLYNKDGKFLRWNRNFELVTGCSSEEMQQVHPLDFFDDSEKELLHKKITNVFVSGEDYVEAHFVTKNKQKIPYYFSGMKIDYEGEECLMGFGLDFSDKVQAEKTIKESEEKFRSLVEQATDGVTILSPEGKVLYNSPAVSRITGYDEEEILSLNLFDITDPTDLGPMKALFENAINHPGVPLKGSTYRLLHKDGSWKWLENTVTSMLHIPSINGIVENFRDVTEKIEIEKIIITEKEISDSIINSLPGIFYLYDNTGKLIRWNKNMESITGYDSNEIAQMIPDDFYIDCQKDMIQDMRQLVFNKRIQDVECTLKTKQGIKIPFYNNLIAIEYHGVPCIIEMGFDLTDRKKIEQELKLSHQKLEKKASELITSYSELEGFAYIVSHDLQEPLRMVSSFLNLLEKKYDTKLDEDGKKYIRFAVDGAIRMKQLIKDLLEYSRTGTNKMENEETDMNKIMEDVLRILKTDIAENQAIIDVSNLPVLFNTNKILMFQLMQNLIGNALKYKSELAPVIHIAAIEAPAMWMFKVKDNGIGLDPKFADKIFLVFQRLHSRNEYSGTGIGLSICKKIVEKHGGKIWVESSPGKGSTFYFTISK
ncbi:MAG: PAS domain S-box protein [Ferruginibacter sp.]